MRSLRPLLLLTVACGAPAEEVEQCFIEDVVIAGFSEEASGRIADTLAEMAEQLRGPMPCIRTIRRSEEDSEVAGGGYFHPEARITVFPTWSDEAYGLPGIIRHELCHAIDGDWGLGFGERSEIPDPVGLPPHYDTLSSRRAELMARLCGLEPEHLALLRELAPLCPTQVLTPLVETVFEEVYWPVESAVQVGEPLETLSWPLPEALLGGNIWVVLDTEDDSLLFDTDLRDTSEARWALEPRTGEWELVDKSEARWPRVSAGPVMPASMSQWRPSWYELQEELAVQSLELPFMAPLVTTWSAVSERGALPAAVAGACALGSTYTVLGHEGWGVSRLDGELHLVSLDAYLDEVVPFPWRYEGTAE